MSESYDPTALRAGVLALLERMRDEERLFERELSPAERAEDGAPGRWGARVVVAHITDFKAEQVIPSALYNLACAHALRGEADSACDRLAEALRFDPGLATAARRCRPGGAPQHSTIRRRAGRRLLMPAPREESMNGRGSTS
jgi:hypothetical protein